MRASLRKLPAAAKSCEGLSAPRRFFLDALRAAEQASHGASGLSPLWPAARLLDKVFHLWSFYASHFGEPFAQQIGQRLRCAGTAFLEKRRPETWGGPGAGE